MRHHWSQRSKTASHVIVVFGGWAIGRLFNHSFQKNLTMCHSTEQPVQQINVTPRKAELIAIQNRGHSGLEQNWSKVWLSANDRFFSLVKMQRTWQQPFTVQNTPHVLFFNWGSWGEVPA